MSKFVWYDLMTIAPQAAITFYSAVMGAQAHPAPISDDDYTILTVNETPIGGIFQLPEHAVSEGSTAVWRGYIYVDDVDAKAKRVTELGGEIYREPWDLAAVGRVAVVADPHGARFILFTPHSGVPPQPEAVGSLGHVGWHELHSPNWEADFPFYADLFGWTKAEAMDMGEMGVYQQFAIHGTPTGGMMTPPCESPRAYWLYYFNVANIVEAAKRITDNGGQLVIEPREVPGGSWILQGIDPQGGHFSLVGPKH